MICCLKWYARCCFVVAIPEKNAVLVFFWVVKDCLHGDFEIQQFCHQVLWNTCSAAIRINPIPFRPFQNVFCKLVHSLLGDSCVAVVEQQTRIDKMKLCWFHVRKAKGRAAKGSGNLGFVSLIGLVEALIFVVASEARMEFDFLAGSPHLHTNGRFVDGQEGSTDRLLM